MIVRYRGQNSSLLDILGEGYHIGVSSEAVSWVVMYVNYCTYFCKFSLFYQVYVNLEKEKDPTVEIVL